MPVTRSSPILPRVSLLKEPLLHFALGGLLLFGLWQLRAPSHEGLAVHVSAQTVERLASDHARRTGQDPDPATLDALVQDHVDRELLYRAGLELGLDRADPVVRRRVVQKMTFLHEATGPQATPDDPDIEAFIAANTSLFQLPPQLAMQQVFVARERADAAADAQALQVRLAADEDPARLGDPFVHGSTFGLRPLMLYARDFGDDFAAALERAPANTWQVLPSPFGQHVVRVTERQAPRPAPLESVRSLAIERMQQQSRQAHATAALEALRARATVTVER